MKKTNILIMVAMQGEAEMLIKKLDLQEDKSAPMQQELKANVFVDNDTHIRLITFGTSERFGVDAIGTQRASLLTWQAIKEYQPDVIVNLGTAGGLGEKGASIGSVYVCTEVVYHDRRINLPKFKEYGIGCFPCFVPDSFKKHGVKFGKLSSGNALDTSETDMQQIHESGAIMKDMEGAAIAEIAEQHNIKYIGIKLRIFLIHPSNPLKINLSKISK
jgi:5'-methylthioadenosine nucleosidase